jgi:hypothetical protein
MQTTAKFPLADYHLELSQQRKLKNHHRLGISCDLNEIITASMISRDNKNLC